MPTVESYIPLHRKYRPQQFSDLVGQEIVCKTIHNALALNKIAHAYLFCGPRGTGKTSSARILAKSLNCAEGPTATPCQTCPSCVSITRGSALDVTEIDAASNNGVDHIRELTDKVQFSPIEGKFKIYIIDEVHMLSAAAFNALLKTLEEPPPNVVFIFATTEPHKVLQTIISRCQRYDFSRITTSQIESRLKQVARWEQIQIAEEAVALIARHAKGGLRDALGLLDQVSVLGRAKEDLAIQPEDVRAFTGALEEELLLAVTQGIIDKRPEKVLEQAGYIQERGIEPMQMLKELTQHFRNLLIAKTCGPQAPAEHFDMAQPFYEKLCLQSEGLQAEEIPQMLSKLSSMEYSLKSSHQPQLWLEVGLLDLCYRHDILLVKNLEERVKALEEAISNGIAPLPASATMAPMKPPFVQATAGREAQPKPEPVIPASLSQPVVANKPSRNGGSHSQSLHPQWASIIENINHSPTKALVKDHFTLLEIEENSVRIGFSSETIFETFKRTPDKSAHLEQSVQAVLGKAYKLDFKLCPNPGSPKPASSSAVSAPSSPANGNPALGLPQPIAVFSGNRTPAEMHSSLQEPSPLPESPVLPIPDTSLPTPAVEEEIDIEMEQAKKYTQELLQGRLLD